MVNTCYNLGPRVPELFIAILKGPQEVYRVFDESTNAHSKDVYENTALLVAAGQGNVETINYLLDRGANIMDKNTFGKSVLHFASARGQEAAVKLFLQQGADLQAIDIYGNTVMHSAAVCGNVKIASLFLDLGVDAKKKNTENETALFCAAKSDSVPVANFLIKQGVDVNEENIYGMTPLLRACEKNSENVVRLLLESGANVQAEDVANSNCLHFAAMNGNENLIELLLDLKIGVNKKDFKGRTALHLAARNGNVKAMELLLDCVKLGLDIDVLDKKRQSALHYACEARHESAARLLLTRGADITVKTVLHSAVKGRNQNIIQLLLDFGIAVDSSDSNGQTPLHVAVTYENLDATKLLLNSGADKNAKILLKGKSVLDIAISGNFETGVGLLLEHGANINSIKSQVLLDNKNKTITKLLLHFGVDHSDNNILASVFCENRSSMAEKICDSEVKLDSTADFFKRHNHHFHVRNYIDESLRVFLDYGLDVNAVGFNGQTIVKNALDSYNNLAAKIITRHVVKMKHQNLRVREAVWNDIMANDKLKAYQTESEKEIDVMKKEVFSNSTVTCFDVLTTRNQHQLVSYARNKDIIQGLKSYEKEKMFPIYGSLMYNQIRRGTWRKLLTDQAANFFVAVNSSKCTDHQLPKLPATFIHELCSYLINQELKMLTRACKSKFYMDIHDVTRDMIFD